MRQADGGTPFRAARESRRRCDGAPVATRTTCPSTAGRSTAATNVSRRRFTGIAPRQRPARSMAHLFATVITPGTTETKRVSGGISPEAQSSTEEHERGSGHASAAGLRSSPPCSTPRTKNTVLAPAGSRRQTKLIQDTFSEASLALTGRAGASWRATGTCGSGILKPRSATARGRKSRTSSNTGWSWKRSWVARFFRVRTSTTSTASVTTTGPKTSSCGSRSNRPANGRTNRSTALPAPARSGVFTLA